MTIAADRALVWIRRDLRCNDHAALYYALRRFKQVYCAFVFDTDILHALPSKQDRRVEFIHASVVQLHEQLRTLGEQSGVQGATQQAATEQATGNEGAGVMGYTW